MTSPRGAGGTAVAASWRLVAVAEVTVDEGARGLEALHIAELVRSFGLFGGRLQLQPIIVDEQLLLIDGRHRLEAAKCAGWSHIAALVLSGTTAEMLPVLEVEANCLRKTLNVLELESVWRSHYEPELRAAAKRRQLEGLRKRGASVPRIAASSPANSLVLGISNNVIGDSKNQDSSVGGKEHEREHAHEPGRSDDGAVSRLSTDPRPESIAHAAKRITGYSLDTLNKVARIRAFASDERLPKEIRERAKLGLQRLARPGASVDAVFRALREHEAESQDSPRCPGMPPEVVGNSTARPTSELDAVAKLEVTREQRALERMLTDCSLLAERLAGSLADQLRSAASKGAAEQEILRASRVSLAYCLATVVAIECDLAAQPLLALRNTGAEVSKLLSHTSTQYLRMRGAAA